MSRMTTGLLRSLLPAREDEPTPPERRPEVPLTREERIVHRQQARASLQASNSFVAVCLALPCDIHDAGPGKWCLASCGGLCGWRVSRGIAVWAERRATVQSSSPSLKGARL
jgi:hypothetical protein